MKIGFHSCSRVPDRLDYFLRSENCLVPIEVKGENNRAQSLKTLIASTNYKDITWGAKLVHGNVGFENNVLTIPQWSAFLLPRVVGGIGSLRK